MRPSRIDYGRLVENALRTVVRQVLVKLGTEGLSSPHHFYITFRTQFPGVEIPAFLRERYPNEMTVVLQHQFWDLEVDEQSFSVTLSFNDQPHRLVIPFEAIKVFADPGVEFGLQFTLESEGDAQVTALRPESAPGPRLIGTPDEAERPEGAEIVTLDRFRKKSPPGH
jgi:uncharacterized protein